MPALPHMSAYLARLPHGLDSFPEAKAKASLYRSTIDATMVPDLSVLPPVLARLLETPAPVSSWINEVHSHALILAARDLRFDSDAAFVDFAYARQKDLFAGRLYRVMLALASPTILLRSGALRWTTFHRGSSFNVEEGSATGAVIRIDHPPGLWHGLLADALIAGLRAVLDLSGAQDVDMHVAKQDAESLWIRGTWR